MPNICVCICTFKRPEMLTNLLLKLDMQIADNMFTHSIIVVDNDKHATARPVIETWGSHSKLDYKYLVEPDQNISLARNKAIKYSEGEFVCLIDDDEFPDDKWLLNLYLASKHYNADGILGPVKPHFEVVPPKWVIKGKLFERDNHSTGYVLEWKNTRTGNALLKRSVFELNEKWFDPNLGSGGEDRDFFKRKIEEGFKFVWCNEAPVYEILSPNRWNRKVLIKRALLRGKMALYRSESKPKSVLFSIVVILIYTLCLPFFFFLGQHIFVKYLIKYSDHLGKVFAAAKINLVKEKYVGS